MHTLRVLAVSLLVLFLTASSADAAIRSRTLRAVTLKAVPVKTGLNGPAAFTFSPKGKIWYLERGTGEVRTLTPTTGADRLFTDITNVDGSGERGALGIALHPRWPQKPFVYVYVTRTDRGTLVNELLRIRAEGGSAAGTKVLFRWAVSGATNHNGGRILFGPDGKLYVVTGDNAAPSTSQQRANLRGKVLRINPDGSTPGDNPFGTRIWAYGIRNSFGMAFDPSTRRLWQTENGPSCNDEINRIVKGGNFAWGPNAECSAPISAADTNQDGPLPRLFPKARFASPIGITGAAFCDGCGLGAALQGDLLFGDVNTSRIRAIQLNSARTGFSASPRIVLAAPTAVYSMEVSPKDRIYFSGPTGIYRLARA